MEFDNVCASKEVDPEEEAWELRRKLNASMPVVSCPSEQGSYIIECDSDYYRGIALIHLRFHETGNQCLGHYINNSWEYLRVIRCRPINLLQYLEG